jgi:hypothetical protein
MGAVRGEVSTGGGASLPRFFFLELALAFPRFFFLELDVSRPSKF